MLEDLPISTCTWEVWLVNWIDMPSYLSEYFITVTNRNCMQLLHSNPGGLTQNGRKLQVFRAGIFTHHMKFNKAHNANIFCLAGPKAVLTRADRCIISLKHVLSGTDLGWSVGFIRTVRICKISAEQKIISPKLVWLDKTKKTGRLYTGSLN